VSTIHVTNWPSRKLHGPGRKLTIMVAPRWWERGTGQVIPLLPDIHDMRAVKSGDIDVATYRRRYLHRVRAWGNVLAPGSLRWSGDHGATGWVGDGDTLCCACSRDAAARGECHRVWAARELATAGWTVVLDGEVS